jgi:hypothetical protein
VQETAWPSQNVDHMLLTYVSHIQQYKSLGFGSERKVMKENKRHGIRNIRKAKTKVFLIPKHHSKKA